MWRAARGTVMRKEYNDLIARLEGANSHARSAFLNNIHQTITEVTEAYSAASGPDRKAFLKEMTKAAREMWNAGDWPSALGLGVSCLNAESSFVPGDDAAYVKRETDRLIKEAAEDARHGS